MESNSPKKIQFAVPLFQSHLDPEAAEQVIQQANLSQYIWTMWELISNLHLYMLKHVLV